MGNLVFLQSIGIPMGIDQAPFWVNLYLYNFEFAFISTLSRTDRYRGFRFKQVSLLKSMFISVQSEVGVLIPIIVFNGGRKTPDGCWKYLTVKGKSCFFYKEKAQHQPPKQMLKTC